MKLFSKLPVSIKDGKYTWNINGDHVIHTFECNQEEADTWLVLHATLLSEDVVVVYVMIYQYSKYMVERRWIFKYKNEQCADIDSFSLSTDVLLL